MPNQKKLLLNVEDVAELTGLPAAFWQFVAANEKNWEIERFIFVAGSYLITRYYLDAYLLDDLGWYFRRFEQSNRELVRSFDRRREINRVEEINAPVQ